MYERRDGIYIPWAAKDDVGHNDLNSDGKKSLCTLFYISTAGSPEKGNVIAHGESSQYGTLFGTAAYDNIYDGKLGRVVPVIDFHFGNVIWGDAWDYAIWLGKGFFGLPRIVIGSEVVDVISFGILWQEIFHVIDVSSLRYFSIASDDVTLWGPWRREHNLM
ncbi:hypothetical protein SUGI_0596160 [Cryptomeria japonica]|nr:hypothetical protein SUGI_0596160 [Cryptomeria japonica]